MVEQAMSGSIRLPGRPPVRLQEMTTDAAPKQVSMHRNLTGHGLGLQVAQHDHKNDSKEVWRCCSN